MTKHDNNAKKSEAKRKQRNIKNNDNYLVVDWIIDRVGGISMREKKEDEDEEEKKRKIVVKKVVNFSKLCGNNVKQIRRHSF